MQNTWDTVVKIASAVAGAIVGALAEVIMSWSSAMTALLVFMVIDSISGLIVAGMGKSIKTESGGLRSRKSRRMRECRQFFTDNFTDICTGEHSFSPFCAVFS